MRIGITGAEGFIGTAFRRYLTTLGETPVVCPRSAFEDPAEMTAEELYEAGKEAFYAGDYEKALALRNRAQLRFPC